MKSHKLISIPNKATPRFLVLLGECFIRDSKWLTCLPISNDDQIRISSGHRRDLGVKTMFYVYIMASTSGVTYIGFTSDLVKRVWEHKNDLVKGFTSKYKCHRLVYYETGGDFDSSLAREKEIKKWRRAKKSSLINYSNPDWKDLYNNII